MSITTVAQETKPRPLKVATHDAPALDDGRYVVFMSQTLDGTTFDAKLVVETIGPRFSLPPDEIETCYPPPSSRGDFADTLPHIVLRRPVLPWERRAVSATASSAAADAVPVPWLAIVLVSDRDRDVTITTVPRASFFAASADNVHQVVLDPDGPDRPGAGGGTPPEALVLELPKSRLPDAHTARCFAHVRDDEVRQAFVVSSFVAWPRPPGAVAEDDATEGDEAGEAVPPEGVRITAHVVSLEELYDTTFADLADGATVRVVSLHHWDYTLLPDDAHGFAHLAETLDHGPLAVPATAAAPDGAVAAAGFVPLDHQLRNGDVATSWYHGPLVPAVPAFEHGEPEPRTDRSDSLLRWVPDARRIDVSYAAAWELGRLLAVHEPDVVEQLLRWKFEREHHALSKLERDELPSMLDLLLRPHDAVARPVAPARTGDWFNAQLSRLGSVPFGYLVPDEAMLPAGSLRFFDVDHRWIDCLHDGALSLSRRAGGSETPPDLTSGDHGLSIDRTEGWSGFLLRSELVSHYPGMIVVAHDRAGKVVNEQRRWSPAPDVLAVLYGVAIADLELENPIRHAHFSAGNRRGHVITSTDTAISLTHLLLVDTQTITFSNTGSKGS